MHSSTDRPLKNRPFSRLQLLVFALAFSLMGVGLYFSLAAGGPNTIYVSTSGDDSTCAANDAAHPCATFNKAYGLAQPGDSVQIAAGTYPSQIISPNASKNVPDGTCSITPSGQNVSSCITFQPAPGAQVITGTIDIFSPDIRLRGLSVDKGAIQVYWKDSPSGVQCKGGVQPHDVIIDDINNYDDSGVPAPGASHGGNFIIEGVYNVAIVNSSFGPFYDAPGTAQATNFTQSSSSYCANYSPDQLKDKNIYLYNNTWHDLLEEVAANGPNCGSDPAQYNCNHMECIHWRASNSWIIDNKFINCAQNDLSVQTFSPSVTNIDNLQVIGNVFDSPCSGQTAPSGNVAPVPFICNGASDSITNSVFAYNSIRGGHVEFSDNGTGATGCFTGTVAVGNLFDGNIGTGCHTNEGAAYAYNVTAGSTKCGSSDVLVASIPWKSAAPPDYDFSLTASPNVYNIVPSSVTLGGITVNCPATDLQGNHRPVSGNTACAAGAIENNPASLPGDANGDGRVDVFDLSILLSHFNANYAPADFNNDGIVDISDLSILLSNFGT